MSASVTTSLRRRPVRATRSSSERKRCDTDPARHSCEHVLQNQRCASTCSSMVGSSHPHFGHGGIPSAELFLLARGPTPPPDTLATSSRLAGAPPPPPPPPGPPPRASRTKR